MDEREHPDSGLLASQALAMAESVRTIPPGFNFERALPTISAREWRLHGGLLLLTIATTILAGIVMMAPHLDAPEPPLPCGAAPGRPPGPGCPRRPSFSSPCHSRTFTGAPSCSGT